MHSEGTERHKKEEYELFGKKKKAIAFIDYEYWFYSYKTRFGITPDPIKWFDEVQKLYDFTEILVFGDFSNPALRDEVGKIRYITNNIIETGNTYFGNKKDMTDFVMLDYIYRAADENRRIRTYLLFTGDGHFQTVVKHLTGRKKKKVVVCGIRDSMSRQLQTVATELIFFPKDEVEFLEYAKMIINNMAYVADKDTIIPTFWGTVDAVSKYNNVPQEAIVATLKKMLDMEYLIRKQRKIPFSKTVTVLTANWEKLIKDGLWIP